MQIIQHFTQIYADNLVCNKVIHIKLESKKKCKTEASLLWPQTLGPHCVLKYFISCLVFLYHLHLIVIMLIYTKFGVLDERTFLVQAVCNSNP